MTTQANNPPAFPHHEIDENDTIYHAGMTLRDYFAAKAMQAMIANDLNLARHPEGLTKLSYAVADAMLKERSK